MSVGVGSLPRVTVGYILPAVPTMPADLTATAGTRGR